MLKKYKILFVFSIGILMSFSLFFQNNISAKNYSAYNNALLAKKNTVKSVDVLNENLVNLKNHVDNFPNDGLFDANYQTRLNEWKAEYQVLIGDLDDVKTEAIDAINAYKDANDAYLASGTAPKDSPASMDLIGPNNYESILDNLAAKSQEIIDNNELIIQEYQNMKDAINTFTQQYNTYSDAVLSSETNLHILNDYLYALNYNFNDGGYNLDILGLSGYDINQVATRANYEPIVNAYVNAIKAEAVKYTAAAQVGIDASNLYITQQQAFKAQVTHFNDVVKPEEPLGFTVNNLVLSLPNIEESINNLDFIIEYNTHSLERDYDIIDANLGSTISDILRGGNWQSNANHFGPIAFAGMLPLEDNFKPLMSLDIPTLKVVEIKAPEDSEKPEKPEKPEIDKPGTNGPNGELQSIPETGSELMVLGVTLLTIAGLGILSFRKILNK